MRIKKEDAEFIEVPRPTPMREPVRVPEREPVPVKRGNWPPSKSPAIPARHASLSGNHPHYLQEIPYACPQCGQELLNPDDNNLVCPTHGVVFSVEPTRSR